MMRATKRLSKTKRFPLGHPFCCFCGGAERSATIDHVSPKACSPEGYCPEEFEFPACEQCNGESRRDDQLSGFYSQLLDSTNRIEHLRMLRRLRSCEIRSHTIFRMHCLIPQQHDRSITSAQSSRQFHLQSRCVPLAYFASRLRPWKENSRTPCTTEKQGGL